MEPRQPSESTSLITKWMGLADANTAGNVHGGAIMRMCDEVAGIAAIRHSGSRVVTAGMDRMTFLNPVFVGMLLTVKATVNAAWKTSMEVGVRVEAEVVQTGEVKHTSTAYLTMVALDDSGRPVSVPPVDPQTEDERRRLREAEHRRSTRLREREEIVAARSNAVG
jgi:acyl-CoA hydrolase